jgi:hypothetical protein
LGRGGQRRCLPGMLRVLDGGLRVGLPQMRNPAPERVGAVGVLALFRGFAQGCLAGAGADRVWIAHGVEGEEASRRP